MIHPNKIAINRGKTEIQRAKHIAATLGPYTAARFLVRRNWSIEAALYIITGR